MRGFNTPSGSELPPRLVKISEQFLEDLVNGRCRGEITPDHPVTADRYCRVMRAGRGWQIKGPDIRALVNYWRREGKPIASIQKGYFYANCPEELKPTIAHLEDRMIAFGAALRGLRSAFPAGIQQKLEL